MSSYENLKIEKSDKFWTVFIARPAALNALNSGVLNELNALLDEVEKQPLDKLQALVLTGEGEKAFVAGADIKEINSLNPQQALEFAHKGQKLFSRLESLQIPVVAAVNGFALGGGLELAMSCDFIYCSENAKFGLPEVSLGLIPGFGGTVRLSRLVGLAKAKEMIYSGLMLNAQQATEVGLALKAVAATELLSEVKKTLDMILTKGPLAVAQAKASVNKTWDLEKDQAMAVEADCFSVLFKSNDVKEGTSAFLEKRKPTFTGK